MGLAALVRDDRPTLLGQQRQGGRHGLVQHLAAQAAADHQQPQRAVAAAKRCAGGGSAAIAARTGLPVTRPRAPATLAASPSKPQNTGRGERAQQPGRKQRRRVRV